MLLSSCLEELEDAGNLNFVWTPEFSFPIASSEFGFIDFIENDTSEVTISTNDEGLVILTYREDLGSQKADEIFSLGNQEFNPGSLRVQAIDGSGGVPVSVTVSNEARFTDEFETEEFGRNEQLDSVVVKSGVLRIESTHNFPTSGSFTLTINSLVREGEPLTRTYQWDRDEVDPDFEVFELIDISGYTIDLTDDGNERNLFVYEQEFTITYENEIVTVLDQLTTELFLENLSFYGVFGDLRTRELEGERDTIELDLFKNIQSGMVFLDNPTLTLTFQNSYGLSIAADFEQLMTISAQGERREIMGSILSDQPIIAANGFDNVGGNTTTAIILDNSNSNIEEMLSILPTQIVVTFDGVVNPGGLENNSYALDSSEISAELQLDLPLQGVSNDLVIQNEYDFSGSDLEDINQIEFVFRSENGFPLDVNLQAYFLTNAGDTLASLFDMGTELIRAAAVDPLTGFVVSATAFETSRFFDADEIDNVLFTDKIALQAVLLSAEDASVPVRILDSHTLQLSISVNTELEIEL
jgi:hypothetical protein